MNHRCVQHTQLQLRRWIRGKVPMANINIDKGSSWFTPFLLYKNVKPLNTYQHWPTPIHMYVLKAQGGQSTWAWNSIAAQFKELKALAKSTLQLVHWSWWDENNSFMARINLQLYLWDQHATDQSHKPEQHSGGWPGKYLSKAINWLTSK